MPCMNCGNSLLLLTFRPVDFGATVQNSNSTQKKKGTTRGLPASGGGGLSL